MADSESAIWQVPVGGEQTTAVLDPAGSDGTRVVFVCAHGAGGSRDDRGMLATRDALRARGIPLVRFNFLYKEKGSGRADPMPRLMETTSAVVARVRDLLRHDAEYQLDSAGRFAGRADWLRIDSTALSPADAAEQIIQHFSLAASRAPRP